MNILAITDISRMAGLFERMAQKYHDLVVVSEIHRGIERLESLQPEVVIIQNHLSGLSADILHKHLKSRLGRRKVRFALISTSEVLDVDLSSRFEFILDPALSDEQLEQVMQKLFKAQHSLPESARSQQPADEIKPESSVPVPVHESLEGTVPVQQQLIPDGPAPLGDPGEQPSGPITYELPRRSGVKIISDFSKRLDTTASEIQTESEPFAYREQELSIKDIHRIPHLLDDGDVPKPWYRRTGVLLVLVTLAGVVVVSLYQNQMILKGNKNEHATVSKVSPDVTQPVGQAISTTSQPLASHGTGRPRTLPGFIPRAGFDKNYHKDNPGWDSYRGQTNEYRVFHEKDGSIKAIQVIDRSGAGIQEAFYSSVLKELTGTAAMRPTSSEIKEGYEIRRGEVAGLQLVQYRDAQGGRMRGFVVTWP